MIMILIIHMITTAIITMKITTIAIIIILTREDRAHAAGGRRCHLGTGRRAARQPGGPVHRRPDGLVLRGALSKQKRGDGTKGGRIPLYARA